MKIYATWSGGSSYAMPDLFNRRDIEIFDSLSDARRTFSARADHDTYYPCVSDDMSDDGGPEMWIYFSDPFECGDAYPDRIVSFGPRGGVVMTRT